MKRINLGRRWFMSSSLAMIAILALAGSTFAGGWCRADPIVEIDGEAVQIWVAIPENLQPAVNGPIQVIVSRPWNANSRVLMLDSGFNGHGERVTFFANNGRNRDGSMDIDVFVVVPINQQALPPGTWQAPVMVEIITAKGKTVAYGNNWWTSARVSVGG
ncbi:MAG: hypothetical protein R3A46_02620 [Thermomicrobiales bacterium]